MTKKTPFEQGSTCAVYPFMTKELSLTGNELLVFAFMYRQHKASKTPAFTLSIATIASSLCLPRPYVVGVVELFVFQEYFNREQPDPNVATQYTYTW